MLNFDEPKKIGSFLFLITLNNRRVKNPCQISVFFTLLLFKVLKKRKLPIFFFFGSSICLIFWIFFLKKTYDFL